jgi:hypothetical protein
MDHFHLRLLSIRMRQELTILQILETYEFHLENHSDLWLLPKNHLYLDQQQGILTTHLYYPI